MGTVHGEELSFVFGAPLVDGIGHFPKNYTRAEVGLSESIVQFFANFVKTGYVRELFFSLKSNFHPKI